MIERRMFLWRRPALAGLRAPRRGERPCAGAAAHLLNPGPEYADANRKFQGIPSIEQARNGRLWTVWYSAIRAKDHRIT